MARAHAEIERNNAANETENFFLVDDVDLTSNAPTFAAAANSEKKRSRRGAAAFYKWQFRRTQGCRPESSQHRGQRFPIPRAARREEGGRHSRFTAVLSQLRIDRHSLVSAHRRRAHRHLSKSARSCKECSVDRAAQAHCHAGHTQFSARLFAQRRAASTPQFAPCHHRRGETASRSGEKFRGTLRPTSFRGLRSHRNFAGRKRESA